VSIGEHQVVQIDRRYIDGVHQRPKQFVGKATRRPDAVLRVTANILLLELKLVVHFAVKARDVVAAPWSGRPDY